MLKLGKFRSYWSSLMKNHGNVLSWNHLVGWTQILWNLSNGHGPRFRGKSKPKSVSHSEHGLTRCGCNLVCTRSFPVGRRSFEYGMGCSKVWHGLVAAGLSGRVVRIHHCPSHYYITTPTTHHPPRHTVPGTRCTKPLRDHHSTQKLPRNAPKTCL